MTEDEKPEDKPEQPGEEAGTGTFLPPLDVSSIILPFYTQALLKMGLIEDPAGEVGPENLDLAKRMIDLLELFRERTQGNLQAEEAKFLESILHQLKLHYMEKAKIIRI